MDADPLKLAALDRTIRFHKRAGTCRGVHNVETLLSDAGKVAEFLKSEGSEKSKSIGFTKETAPVG